jgi:hypothetical protein
VGNQRGDRYVCSNATCGCEMEVRRPSDAALSAGANTSGPREVGVRDELSKSDSIMDMTCVRAEDASLPPPRSGPGVENETRFRGTEDAPRCFCGSPMVEAATGVRQSCVATVRL